MSGAAAHCSLTVIVNAGLGMDAEHTRGERDVRCLEQDDELKGPCPPLLRPQPTAGRRRLPLPPSTGNPRPSICDQVILGVLTDQGRVRGRV